MENRYFMTSDGIRLHYTVTGSGTPVLFLPGLGQDAASVQNNADIIGEKYAVFVLDYRNHGESEDTLRGNHIEQYAKDMKEMLDDAEIRDFDLIAHSMGNAIAWCFMELYGTDRIRRYILAEEAPILLSDPSWTETEQLTYRGLREWPSFIPVKYPENVRESAIALIWHDHVNRDWRDAFERIVMPTLIIMGSESHYASEDLWQWLRGSCRNSELLVLKGGHGIHIDCCREFNEAVLAFLAKSSEKTADTGISASDREMKNKYAVDSSYDASGKTVAVIGAGGRWGSHLAIGMALTSGCDLILVETPENRENMELVLKDLSSSKARGNITAVYLKEEILEDHERMKNEILSQAGPFDSIMDVRKINC
ncbi:MAG: alpha/beta hydrolase [Solobacterium sp.]|nr:alpha/beta hydrolase [Solobacterium sp.]